MPTPQRSLALAKPTSSTGVMGTLAVLLELKFLVVEIVCMELLLGKISVLNKCVEGSFL